MEQLIFDLAFPEPPAFANFLPGRNAELVAALSRVAAGNAAETGLFIWGVSGAGKTHLLRAVVAATAERGAPASYFAESGALLAIDPEMLAPHSVVAVDEIDAARAEAQAKLFTLFNTLRAGGGHFVAASRGPPAGLELREDLRTRLGWGLVYELLPLADSDKAAALTVYARQRGFGLSDDVIRYLLAHGQRDMTTLLGVLAALDRHSLATKRPITIPLLRDWLQRDIRL
jgi:DnaA family protein